MKNTLAFSHALRGVFYCLILSGTAFGQVRYDNRVVTVASNVPVGANAPVLAIPNALVTICVDGNCITKAPVWSDQGETVPGDNPMKTDGQGRFGFWAASGTYFKKVVLPSGALVGIYPITLGGSGGGGGGITQLTGDVAAAGSGSVAATLATVNTGPGTCGDATHVCQIVDNGKGLVISQTPVAITGGGGGSSVGTAGQVQKVGATAGSFAASSITDDASNVIISEGLVLTSTGAPFANGLGYTVPGANAFNFLAWGAGNGAGLPGTMALFDATNSLMVWNTNSTDDLFFNTPISGGNVAAGAGATAGIDHLGKGTFSNIVDSALTPGTSPICPNGTGGAFTTSGCAGGSGSGISGQTAGYAIEAATATTATTNFPLDDSITTAATITAHKKFAVVSGGTDPSEFSLVQTGNAPTVVTSAFSIAAPTTVTTANTVVGFAAPCSGVWTLANSSGVMSSTCTSAGTGTVTSASVVTANGVSGSVATATTTPAITLTLGAITPSSVASTGPVSGTTGTFTGGITAGATGGVGGQVNLPEGTAATASTGNDICYGDSTAHDIKCSLNNGSFFPLVSTATAPLAISSSGVISITSPLPVANGGTGQTTGTVTFTVASGTSALGTSAIASATCATVVTTTATGTASTDAISWNPNGSIKAVTGYIPSTSGGLTISGFPTANAVNWDVCNWTSASITPGAVTLNWRVTR